MSRSILRRLVQRCRASARWYSAAGLAVTFVVVATLSLSASAGASPARAGAAASHALSPCSSAQLVIWLDTAGDGTAGSTYYNLEFTNLGSRTCTIAAFPGVSAIGLTGAQVGLAAARTNLGTTPVVQLAPGATATSVVQLTDTGNLPSANCHQVLAAGLRVYAPGSTASKTVAYPFEACSLTKVTFLHVRPMEKGVLPQ
jgi:hypothetical protein